MSNIDKQAVQAVADLKAGYTLGHADAAILNELARIALASLEAKAVAYIIQDSEARSRGEKGILRYFANISDEDINEYEITVTPLYTAPPAPVSVPDAVDYSDLDATSKDREVIEAIAECKGWNACRAAILQGADGNSPVIPDGWVMVPIDMAPEMMRAVQLNSELGGYAAANLSGAYSLFREFWDVAIAAAPQQEA